MLARSNKLNWGLGHRALKVILNEAIEPLLTYGAPVWEKALTKQKKLEEIPASAKIEEYKNSQGIQNTVI